MLCNDLENCLECQTSCKGGLQSSHTPFLTVFHTRTPSVLIFRNFSGIEELASGLQSNRREIVSLLPREDELRSFNVNALNPFPSSNP